MRKYVKKENWLTILGLLLIAGVLYSLWLAVSFFITSLATADPKISAAIIGAMTTIFVGIAAVIITQRQIKLREIEEAHREKKVEIYQKFMGTITSLIAGQNKQVTIEAPTEQELIDYLVGFKTEILLWGSPKVIKSQLEFERVSGFGGDVFMAVNNLYKAIREDIGLSNTGLNNLELVKIFLKDPDELDKIRAF
jgi:membrane protein implicated in regulation of membrane protease activity